MHEPTILKDLLVVFAVAIAVVTLLRRIRVPAIAGFIVAGALVGPRALGLVSSTDDVETLAEVGVILLLFGIGVELSLDRLKRLWRAILIGGALQMGLTIGLSTLLGLALDLAPKQALFFGFLLSTSSTAIVLRGLENRGEVDAPHGRLTLGILVFQDLSVVPMMLVVPLLAGETPSGSGVVWILLRAALVILGLLFVARLLVPRLMHLIARTRQRDLFVLAVLVICLGIAYAASLAGVSLALGAFLAGLVVAGTVYRHQALAELIPFREVLTSLFFVSIGMLLDFGALLAQPLEVLGLTVVIFFGKALIVLLAAVAMRLGVRVAVLAAMALAQVGEFSFVLARAATGTVLVADPIFEAFAVSAIITMLLAPYAMMLGPHVAAGAGKSRALTLLLDVPTAHDASTAKTKALADHVIIAGLGVAGEELASSLRERGVPYVICELNAETVRRAVKQGEPAYFGDITSPEVLLDLGIERAKELIIVINDPAACQRAVLAARTVAPQLPITARARYLADVDALLRAGASDVVAAELEASAEIVERALLRQGVPEGDVRFYVRRVRARGAQGERRERHR